MQPSPCTEFTKTEQELLLEVARSAIAGHLLCNEWKPDYGPPPDSILLQRLGVFVTLTHSSRLRGCIGTIEGSEPLIEAVADCAQGAAFRDPRFPPVEDVELEQLRVEISVLSAPYPVAANSREELLDRLRPGIDGLVIEDGLRRATFLPQVWEQLPDAQQFLSHLLQKAGLAGDYWSASLRCSCYQSTSFTELKSAPG